MEAFGRITPSALRGDGSDMTDHDAARIGDAPQARGDVRRRSPPGRTRCRSEVVPQCGAHGMTVEPTSDIDAGRPRGPSSPGA